MKQKWIACLAVFTLAISFIYPIQLHLAATTDDKMPINEKLGVPIVVYGSKLIRRQKKK